MNTDKNGWHPITTGPKDGTPVLLYIEGKIRQCVWEKRLQVWRDGFTYWNPNASKYWKPATPPEEYLT